MKTKGKSQWICSVDSLWSYRVDKNERSGKVMSILLELFFVFAPHGCYEGKNATEPPQTNMYGLMYVVKVHLRHVHLLTHHL